MSRFLPEPTKISRPFWDSCKAGAMKMQRCADCGNVAFYPVYVCPECASRKLEWTPMSGRGEVHTYTIAPSTFEDGTMVVALVELEEGAMMTSNIVNVAPGEVHVGMKVKVTYRAVSDAITLPLYEPAR